MREGVFDYQMRRLEEVFKGGVELPVRGEYWQALHYVEDDVFEKAVNYVMTSFKPFPSEPFPSIATLESAVIDMKEEGMDEVYEPERNIETPDYSILDFCQKCNNAGIYIWADGLSHFCQCEKGRLKQAAWDVEPAHSNWEKKKRDEKIQRNLARLPPSLGPVRGIKEWNSLGFWEDTKEEHDRWCADKRKQIEEIKARREEFEEKRCQDKKMIAPGSLKRVLEETLAQVSEKMPAEDDEVPF
jgi:hypothetical protein